MSTELMLTNLELMRPDLEEFITDDNLDMLNEFTEKTLADLTINIAARLMVSDSVLCILTKDVWNYQVKVNNRMKGFVSCSEETLGITGVSRTEYKPFFYDEEEGYFSGLCNLAQMINEAWYNCNS